MTPVTYFLRITFFNVFIANMEWCNLLIVQPINSRLNESVVADKYTTVHLGRNPQIDVESQSVQPHKYISFSFDELSRICDIVSRFVTIELACTFLAGLCILTLDWLVYQTKYFQRNLQLKVSQTYLIRKFNGELKNEINKSQLARESNADSFAIDKCINDFIPK